jgi:pimeloyl-ACP methyl ester carboxylesterase
MRLEVLSHPPRGEPPRTSLLFVHGAYVGAWCWEEHFLPWFAARGFPAHAVSLRGHGKSSGRDELHRYGLADYAEDVARAAALLDEPPVLVGHSMGALVVQKYLEQGGKAAAAVLVCPVPGYGLMPATMALAWTRPALFMGIQSLAAGGDAPLSVLSEAMFAGRIEPERLARYVGRMQGESRRALMDMAGFGLPQAWLARRPATLVLGASRDALIPPLHAQAAAALSGAEYELLEGLGHAVMLDEGWERAAAAIAAWLERSGL